MALSGPGNHIQKTRFGFTKSEFNSKSISYHAFYIFFVCFPFLLSLSQNDLAIERFLWGLINIILKRLSDILKEVKPIMISILNTEECVTYLSPTYILSDTAKQKDLLGRNNSAIFFCDHLISSKLIPIVRGLSDYQCNISPAYCIDKIDEKDRAQIRNMMPIW